MKIAAVLLATSLLGLPAGAFAQSQPVLRGYAVLGVGLVRVGPSVRVQPGSVGATTGAVRLATAAQVSGAVVAGTVHVARRARVGRLYCQVVSGSGFGSGVVGGPTVGGSPIPGCAQLTTPLVDPPLLVPIPVTPGTTDEQLAPRSSSAPLAPGQSGFIHHLPDGSGLADPHMGDQAVLFRM